MTPVERGEAARAADVTARARTAPARREPPIISGTGLGQTSITTGSQVLRRNPTLEIQWRSTTSPVTNRSGFSGPLQRALDAGGINSSQPVAGKPVGGTTSNSPAARTQNGAAAERAIANQMRTDPRYSNVQTQVPVRTSRGTRIVDVIATERARNPEFNKRIEVESKLGRASASTSRNGTLTQVAKDAERIAENTRVRGWGTTLKSVGRVARPIGMAIDAVQLGQAFRADGNRIGDRTQRAAGSLAGGAAGAWGGAQAGAAIGSLGGPVGTVVGGVVGGVIGGVIGSGVGEKAVGWVKSWF